jgi:hypothetical protein
MKFSLEICAVITRSYFEDEDKISRRNRKFSKILILIVTAVKTLNLTEYQGCSCNMYRLIVILRSEYDY